MGDRGVEHVGGLGLPFGREGAADPPAAIDDRLGSRRVVEGRDLCERAGFEPLLPLLAGEIEARGRQRLVVGPGGVLAVDGAALGVGVGDLGDALGGRLFGAGVEHEGRVADIVEQRVEAVVEERQPVLEADRAPAFADCGVEGIVRRGRAELLGVELAEATDRVGREPRLAHRHEVEGAELADAALGLGIEGADRLQRVAEEVEPDRVRRARRIEVEDAAARGVVADVAHRAGAGVAVGLEPERQVLHPHAVAGRGREGGGGDVFQRRQALGQRIDGDDKHARPLDRAARAGEARQHGHPLGGDGGVGRHAVVGLAVPRGQIERLDLRGGEGQRIDEGLRPEAVPGDEDERRRAAFAGFGEERAQAPPRRRRHSPRAHGRA